MPAAVTDYDYVVVGAGAAGCVLAERLSRDPRVSVALLEAGGLGRHPVLHIPKAFVRAMQDPRWTYSYPASTGDGRTETWLRGRMLGGSTGVNGLLYLRGEPAAYDALAARGNPGWGAAELRAASDGLEGRGGPGAPGRVGHLPVTVPELADVRDEVLDAAIAAAASLGIRFVADLNAADGPRLGVTPVTVEKGRRVSAASAFLHPARRRPNLTVLDRTVASHVVLRVGRAVGVAARSRGRYRELGARREVLICGGTVETPVLLERSGIGRPDVLERIGVAIRRESPNVGERVIEHRGVTVKFALNARLGLGPRLDSVPRQARELARYLLTRRGPIARGAYELAALVATDGGARPDAQLLITSLATDDTGLAVAHHPGLMVVGYALQPSSMGSVHAGGPSPDTVPVIETRFMDTQADRAAAEAVLAWQRRLLASEPLASLVAAVTAPWPGIDAADYAALTGTGIFHAVGSCAMGPDELDVVDPRLRVRGVPGLRVVDASVFPRHPSGALAAPVMAAAWRAADFIEEEAG